MFALIHQTVANELLRVCRPGGTIGMLNFTPTGGAADFFSLFARYALPPPPHALPSFLWRSEDHVRNLFGDRIESLQMTGREYIERAASAHGYLTLFKENFGPMVALYASLSDQPERVAPLDRDFLEVCQPVGHRSRNGPVEVPYEYVVVVAHKHGRQGR